MSNEATNDRSKRLTPREQEVLAYAAKGMTSKQIGQLLGLAEATVKESFGRMMQRFGCANRMQLLSYVSSQLTPDEDTST